MSTTPPGFKGSSINQIWNLLEKQDRRKVKIITLIQICSSVLDLIGVALIGLVGAVAISGLGPAQSNSRINQVLEFFQLDESSFQVQVAVLAVAATGVLVFKTIFSVYFTKRTLTYLSLVGARMSSRLIKQAFQLPFLKIQERSQHEILFAITGGPNTMMVGILGNLIAIISDFSLLILLCSTLIIVSFSAALTAIVLFSFIGYVLFKLLHRRARDLGQASTSLNVLSSSKIVEVLAAYKVLFVKGRRDFFADEIATLRLKLGKLSGELAFMPFVSKYVVESAIILSTLILAASQFLLKDATNAAATLTIFLAAGSRIAPATLRIQQGALLIKGNLGICDSTLRFIERYQLSNASLSDSEFPKLDFDHIGFVGDVKVRDIAFGYSEEQVFTGVDFSVSRGDFVSIVGPSGAGKSTLADIVLGVIEPEEGYVEISGMKPVEAIQKWPGAIAYVPQEVSLISGSIKENVSMGFNQTEISDELVEDCLKIAQLSELIENLPRGIHTELGERGIGLSGGQKQRIGIARALVTNPQVIVFDEATSSLDGITENAIAASLQALRGRITIIMIAHRLSTVRNSNQVIYLANGKMQCKGSFDQVRSSVPDFDTQAKLLGL